MKTLSTKCLWLLAMMTISTSIAHASPPLKLPKPQIESGNALMPILKARKSTRSFSTEKLPLQTLSDLLWAAFGVNRAETGGRTAPSTRDWQDIDIYVATADGVYLFDAKNHALNQTLVKDIRALTGTQNFVADAPVNLIYVSDFTRMDADIGSDDKKIAAAIDTGFIGQNVYLYCASKGLATVVRGSIDTDTLAKAMNLKPSQWIVAAQSVGFPKK